MFRSLILLSHLQIIQTEGSYSFLLCGMIIACIGFILFIGLLLFHRMHRNYLTGTASARILRHSFEINNCGCAESLFVCFSLLINPLSKPPAIQTGTSKKSAMVEEPATEQNEAVKTEQIDNEENIQESPNWCAFNRWLVKTEYCSTKKKSSSSVCKCIFFVCFAKQYCFRWQSGLLDCFYKLQPAFIKLCFILFYIAFTMQELWIKK